MQTYKNNFLFINTSIITNLSLLFAWEKIEIRLLFIPWLHLITTLPNIEYNKQDVLVVYEQIILVTFICTGLEINALITSSRTTIQVHSNN